MWQVGCHRQMLPMRLFAGGEEHLAKLGKPMEPKLNVGRFAAAEAEFPLEEHQFEKSLGLVVGREEKEVVLNQWSPARPKAVFKIGAGLINFPTATSVTVGRDDGRLDRHGYGGL